MSRITTKPLDAKIQASIAAIKAAEENMAGAGDDEFEPTPEELEVGEKVTATLNAMGISNRVLRAKFIAGVDVDLPEIDPDQIDAEDIPDDMKDEVTAGTLKVLAALGYDLDEDDENSAGAGKMCAEDLSDDEDEALDQVTAMISAFTVKHCDTSVNAKKLHARLTASLQVTNGIVAKQRRGRR